jgi:CRISPR/Cas system-associated exonuclease Cas4 (RecB family)
MEEKYLEEYRNNGINFNETHEKLNISVVRQRLIERKEKLLRDVEYYNYCVNDWGANFREDVTYYIRTIETRLVELDYLLENVV